jgi:hypothetical protein
MVTEIFSEKVPYIVAKFFLIIDPILVLPFLKIFHIDVMLVSTSVADPGSDAFLTPGSGMGINQDTDPG